jgi:hypothetical protein
VWRPDNVHPVELHYRIREEYAGLAYDFTGAMWSAADERSYWNGSLALVPPPSGLLHHLCAHATSDWLIRRGKLMEIGDVAMVASRMTPTEWDEFIASIPSRGARFVYPALAIAGRYAPGSIPQPILTTLRARVAPQLRAWCAAVTLAEASESNPRSRDGIGLGMARLLASSRGERARMWLRSVFPRRWNLVKRYPRLAASPLFPLCYLLINADRAWHILKARLRSCKPIAARPPKSS